MIDAYHASEATPFAGFDPRQRVLEQDRMRGLNPEAAFGFQIKCRIRFARQPKSLRVKDVDADVQMMIEARSVKNSVSILAR